MEHTQMSSMGGWSRSLIAHELGHQWFGMTRLLVVLGKIFG